MPWRGVTVSEQRQRFLEDYQLNYYPVTELAERFGISRKTAYPGLTTSLPWQSRGQASGSGGSSGATFAWAARAAGGSRYRGDGLPHASD